MRASGLLILAALVLPGLLPAAAGSGPTPSRRLPAIEASSPTVEPGPGTRVVMVELRTRLELERVQVEVQPYQRVSELVAGEVHQLERLAPDTPAQLPVTAVLDEERGVLRLVISGYRADQQREVEVISAVAIGGPVPEPEPEAEKVEETPAQRLGRANRRSLGTAEAD